MVVKQDLVANASNLVAFMLENKKRAEADPIASQPEIINDDFLGLLKSTEQQVESFIFDRPMS